MLVKAKTNWPTTRAVKVPLGNGRFALIDLEDYHKIAPHRWYAKKSFHCWYACRKITINGKPIFLRMHRIIANTPAGWICHHINGNTLDNRKANLLNMTLYDHTKMHSYR